MCSSPGGTEVRGSSFRNHSSPCWMMEFVHFGSLRGIVQPKMTILSSFTHLPLVPNLYEFLFSSEHKRRYLEECW